MSASARSTSSVASVPHWIGGKAVPGAQGRTGDVFDPSTGRVAARVPFASVEELDACIRTAQAALPGWSTMPPLRRARVMFRFRDLLDKASGEIAEAISREHGKTLSDARGEVVRGMEVVEFACGIPDLLKGEHN